MKIAIAQVNTISGNITYNSNKIKDYALKAYKGKADILVFPELMLSGGFAKDLYLRKDFLSACDKELKVLSKELKTPVLLGSVYKNENAVVYIKDSKISQIASKNILCEEKKYFKTDDISIQVDNFYACIYSNEEDLKKQAKNAKEKNSKILFVLANDFYYMGRIQEVYKQLKNCALENNITLIFVNMVGAQDGLVSYGGSVVVSKTGSILNEPLTFEENLFIIDIDEKINEDFTYETSYEEEAYDALVLGLKDYAQKNSFKKIVLGISGGVDSALVATIAKDALGSQNVIGIFMPSQFTSKQSLEDSQLLCKLNGIKLLNIPIEPIFNVFKTSLKEIFAGTKEDLTEENLQARIRGILLMAYSNKFNALLVNTGNKSECAVGYSTLYGDSVGGYAVVCDITKTFLYRICKYRNTLIYSIPKSIIEREPTAELHANQKDSDSLPVYEKLDASIIKYLNMYDTTGVQSNIQNEDKKIFKMIERAQYKREQCPFGTKISKLSFVRDIKIPITNGYK